MEHRYEVGMRVLALIPPWGRMMFGLDQPVSGCIVGLDVKGLYTFQLDESSHRWVLSEQDMVYIPENATEEQINAIKNIVWNLT